MRAGVAIYTFAVTVFVVFLLWGTQNLGLIGLLSAFSVGLISYSMDSSLEMAVASVVLAGVLIKVILPYVQNKWIENYRNVSEIIGVIDDAKAKAAGGRSVGAAAGAKKMPAEGLAPTLLEGFADGATAGAAAPIQPGVGLAGATGTPAVPGQQSQAPVVGMGAAATTLQGQQGQQAPQGAMTFAPNVTTSGATGLAIPGTAPTAPMGAVMPAGGVSASQPAGVAAMASPTTTSAPSTVIPGTASMAAPVGMAVPSTLTVPTAAAGVAAQLTPAAPGAAATAGTMNAALQPTVPGGAVAGIPGGAATAVAAPAAPGLAAPAAPGLAGFRNIERFQAPATEEQSRDIPGMFKLGELPSETKGGPHIDAGTTIMRALGALNPDQIGSLTDDTRKLLDTQKSLMGMLSTMKPMLSDGQNLLASFNNMFGSSTGPK
jgi:hypothetical protein